MVAQSQGIRRVELDRLTILLDNKRGDPQNPLGIGGKRPN